MKSFLPLLACLLAMPAPAIAGEAVDYLRDVKPVLKQRCFACHGALKQKGKLRLDAGSLIRKGGRHGPAVTPNGAAKMPKIPNKKVIEPRKTIPVNMTTA